MSSENKSLQKAKYDIPLTPEDYENIEQLSAANYSPRRIALYLQKNENFFVELWKDKTHKIRHHYERGQLIADYEINEKLLENAKKGNITAAQIFEKNKDANKVENLKEQMLYGH